MVERPAKILVVDDVPENVRLLEAVLVPRGYEVVTASDGLEALEVVAAEEPDLILLDVMMPGLDGSASAPSCVRTKTPVHHLNVSQSLRRRSTSSR